MLSDLLFPRLLFAEKVDDAVQGQRQTASRYVLAIVLDGASGRAG